MNITEIIAFNLKRLRQEKGYSIKATGRLGILQRRQVQLIENNHIPMRMVTFAKIGLMFNVDFSELLKEPPQAEGSLVSANSSEIKSPLQSIDPTLIVDIFSSTLKKIRIEKGLTKGEVSRRCNFTKQYIHELEKEGRDILMESVEKIANVLNVDILEFFKAPQQAMVTPVVENISVHEEILMNEETSLDKKPVIVEEPPVREVGL
jgi:transcriptional regulator with XRE-family HTH domain